MKPALAYKQPHLPSQWHELPNGDLMLDEINNNLSNWWPRFFGYHLLKIGALSRFIESDNCAIKHQVTISENAEGADVLSDIDDLPLLEHSVDVCVLSHALEYVVDPHHVIREANRVLIPNGYLVITGFNPFSFVGLNKLVPFRRQTSPWSERFFSPMRVKDWLHLMGYEILSDDCLVHSTLAGSIGQGWFSRNWQRFANRYLSRLGSIYVIVAKKRMLPLTPIKPKWKLRPKFEPINISGMNSSSKSRSSINK